jgi:predicted Zn-dependent protease
MFGFLMIAIMVGSCNEVDRFFNRDNKKTATTYSFSCLDSAVSGGKFNRRLGQAGDIIRDLAVSEKSITDSIQTAYGRAFHQQMLQEKRFKIIPDKALNSKLYGVLKQLLEARDNPSNIDYAVYALADTAVNAFTFGGRIYITSAMLDKCKGKDALLYAIVGHEIGHSEMGHIKATIQDIELSSKVFGENNTGTYLQLKQLLTASFNQKNELEADYYGINLTNKLDYDVCTAVAFWKEMASNENRYSQVEDFFRTHPFSGLRSDCLTNHIRTNFGQECGKVTKEEAHPQVMEP